jgi:hypothetical protein
MKKNKKLDIQAGLPKGHELHKRIENLEKDKRSLKSTINELKGRMLELVVWSELNRCKKENTPINNFRNRLRRFVSNHEMLEKCIRIVEKMTFDMVWMNYFLNMPATMPLEIGTLAIYETENAIFAIAFETKNKNEKNLPTIDECKSFKNKLKILTNSFNPKKKALFMVFISVPMALLMKLKNGYMTRVS